KEPAADKSLDVLTVEATAMLKIHARSAGRLKEKSTVISEIAKGRKKIRTSLKKRIERLDKAIDIYAQILKGEEKEEKIARLRSLETELKKESADVDSLLQDYREASKDASTLTQLLENIQHLANDLRQDIPEAVQSREYKLLEKAVKQIETHVTGLIPPAKEHAKDLDRYLPELQKLNDEVREKLIVELTDHRREMTERAESAGAQAALHKRLAEERQKTIERITQEKAKVQEEKESVQRTLEQRAAELADVNKLVDRWKTDLRAAQDAAKKNPNLEENVSIELGKELKDQSNILTILISVINSKENAAAILEEELRTWAQRRDDLAKEKESLASARDSTEKAKTAAGEESEGLNSIIKELNDKIKAAAEKAAATTEERVRKEGEAELKRLNEELQKAKDGKSEADTEQSRLNDELGRIKSRLEESGRTLEEVNARLPELERAAAEARGEADTTKAEMERVVKEKDGTIKLLEYRIGEAKDKSKAAGIRIRDSTRKVTQLEIDLKEIKAREEKGFADLNKAWSAAGRIEDKMLEFKSAKEELDKALAEEKKKNEALVRERKEKVTALLKDIRELQGTVRMMTAQGAEAKASAERLMAERRRKGERLKKAEAELKEAKTRVKLLESYSLEEANQKEIERLKGVISGKENEIEGLKQEVAGKDSERRTAEETARTAERDAENFRRELESKEKRFESDVASIRTETEEARRQAEGLSEEIDRLGGELRLHTQRNYDLKTRIAELKTKTEEMEQSITEALQRHDDAIAMRLREEIEPLIEEELKLMKAEVTEEERVTHLTRMLYQNLNRLFHSLETFRTYAESEMTTLREEVQRLNDQFEISEGQKRMLQEKEIPQLEAELREQRAIPKLTDEVRERIATLENNLREAMKQLELEIAVKEAADNELKEAKQRLADVEAENQRLSSRRESYEEIDISDLELFEGERAQWFAKIIQPAHEKLAEAKLTARSDPRVALAETDEAQGLAEKADEDNKNSFSKEERMQMDGLLREISIFKGNLVTAISDLEVTEPRVVLKPARVGALIPFTSAAYDMSVKEYSTPDSGGVEVPSAVLDYKKKIITVGRTLTYDTSKKGLQKEKCDIVITGEKEYLTVSRKHLEIVREDETFTLHYHGTYTGEVVPASGDTMMIEKGDKIPLKDGTKIFLDPEKNLGFLFTIISSAEAERRQSLSWFKTVVEFTEKRKVKERLGYLLVPSHVRVAEELREQSLKPSKTNMIILNHEVKVGKAKGNNIVVDTHDSYTNVVNEGGQLKSRSIRDSIASYHLKIIRKNGEYILERVNKDVQTFVNYRPVDHTKKLENGDVIHLGENEPVFFTFGIKEFEPDAQVVWEKYALLFDYENFNCPMVDGLVGIVRCPNGKVSVTDYNGRDVVKKDGSIILNKYSMVFGSSKDKEVVIECDDNLVNPAGIKIADLCGDEHFMLTRGFGQQYVFKSLDKWNKIVLVSGGQEFQTPFGGVAILQSGDVIKLFESKDTFIEFKVERLAMKTDDYWQQARIRFVKPSAWNAVRKLIG
ncbi:FHA domain-containing protein, partial [Candidatus Woesearchaeota archaeon]|nr:FHA domain-containing protein [Candidatus Woesearchaeota archaeon]